MDMRIDKERLMDMVSMRIDGATLQEIGDKYGVSKERVQKIICNGLSIGNGNQRRLLNRTIYPGIRKWFEETCATITEFAEQCGLTVANATRILEGKSFPRADAVKRILQVTGLTFEEAFYSDE